jgi:hypothetical protein
MTATVTLQDIAPDLGPGNWDTPAGTTRLYRLDVVVFTNAEPPGVNVTLQFSGGVVSGTVALKAWRTGPASAYVYQVGTGNLVVHNVDLNGTAVSAFVEITTDAAVIPGTAQSANLTITPVGGTGATGTLTGQVVIPEDQRAGISIVMDQTMGNASINQMTPAKAAASLMIDFMRDDDWAAIWYLQSDALPKRPISGAYMKNLGNGNRTTVKGFINTIPTRPLGVVNAGQGINTVSTDSRTLTNSCVCAPPTKATLLLSCISAGNDVPVGVFLSVANYAVWLGPPPAAPPTGAYTQFNLPNPSDPTAQFLLRKFLLQIVAASTGLETIFDPDGSLQGNQQAEISFDVSDADSDVRVVLLSDSPELIDLELKSDEQHVVPGRTIGAFRRRHEQFQEISIDRDYGRVRHHAGDCGCGGGSHHPHLPPAQDALPAPKSGKWKAVVSLNRQALESGERPSRVPYSVVVFARSRVKFNASVQQDTEVLGGTAFISAELTDSGVPISGDRAQVVAQVTFPDGGKAKVPLRETSEGRYEARVTATRPGVTTFRIMASGRRVPEGRFQRELTYTTLTRTERECFPHRERDHRHREQRKQAALESYGGDDQADNVGGLDSGSVEEQSPVPRQRAVPATRGEPAGAENAGRSLVQRIINAVAAELLR